MQQIDLLVTKVGSPTDDLKVGFCQNDGGCVWSVSGIVASSNILGSDIPTTKTSFSSAQFIVPVNYWDSGYGKRFISVTRTGSSDGTNYFRLWFRKAGLKTGAKPPLYFQGYWSGTWGSSVFLHQSTNWYAPMIQIYGQGVGWEAPPTPAPVTPTDSCGFTWSQPWEFLNCVLVPPASYFSDKIDTLKSAFDTKFADVFSVISNFSDKIGSISTSTAHPVLAMSLPFIGWSSTNIFDFLTPYDSQMAIVRDILGGLMLIELVIFLLKNIHSLFSA